MTNAFAKKMSSKLAIGVAAAVLMAFGAGAAQANTIYYNNKSSSSQKVTWFNYGGTASPNIQGTTIPVGGSIYTTVSGVGGIYTAHATIGSCTFNYSYTPTLTCTASPSSKCKVVSCTPTSATFEIRN